MSDETPLGAKPADTPAAEDPLLHTVLTLDDLLNGVRRTERTAHICLRADLEREIAETLADLALLIDEKGTVIKGPDEESLVTTKKNARAQELSDRAQELQAEMSKHMRRIRFRAMGSEEWDDFDKPARDDDGNLKDPVPYYNQLIARCAIEPKLTLEQVEKMRATLTKAQFVTLSNEAYLANVTGGIDVPKLPSYSLAAKRRGSSRS